MRVLFLLFFISLFSSCYQVERNCSHYKTGDFYSETIINEKLYKSTFKRNDTLQIENFEGKVDSSQVRWINDCEIIFKTIKPKSMAEQKDIHLKILTTTDSSYTYEYSYVGETIKQRGVAHKVNNN